MAKRNMVIQHRLTQEEALRRIKTLLGEVEKEFSDKISNLQQSWNGNTGNFSFSKMGFSVSGILTVKPSEVELFVSLPFAAMFLGDEIESTMKEIRKRAEKLLA